MFPRFLLPAVCLPRSACRFWDWTWGTRSRAKHFPISLRGSFAAFLGLGLCGLLRLHRPGHLHSPTFSPRASPSRATAAWATTPTTSPLDDHDRRATKAYSPIVLASVLPISYQQAQRRQGKREWRERDTHTRTRTHTIYVHTQTHKRTHTPKHTRKGTRVGKVTVKSALSHRSRSWSFTGKESCWCPHKDYTGGGAVRRRPFHQPRPYDPVSSSHGELTTNVRKAASTPEAMTTAAVPASAHDVYDPDAVVPRNSPLLVPKKVTFRPSISPPPDIPLVQVSPSPSPDRRKTKQRRRKVRPSQGDAVLIGIMDNGRHPDIATMAGQEALPSDSEEVSSSPDTDSSMDDSEPMADSDELGADGVDKAPARGSEKGGAQPGSPADLQTLAGGALAALALGDHKSPSEDGRTSTTIGDTDTEASRPSDSSPPPSIPRPETAIRRDERPQPVIPAPYSPTDYYSPRTGTFTSPTGSLAGPGPGELPPIQNASPRSESNAGVALPSIRDHLGPEALSPASFQQSPPAIPGHGMTRLPSISHASPPISPHELYARDPRSPHSVLLPPSPFYPFPPSGMTHRPSIDYNSGSTPSTDHSASTPATSTHSVADRMSLDGMAFSNPQDVGQYVCKFEGCRAAPFQTQYLLNSHANVHSQSRPHYCPVKGCPRSEGGKGFKRKNEMIRHGLVHESPGYVCPFCPDREHKYPRPDNLQRFVETPNALSRLE